MAKGILVFVSDEQKVALRLKELRKWLLNLLINFDMRNIVNTINQKLKQSQNESIKEIFGETQTVLSLKQSPNVLRLLSRKNTVTSRFCFIVIIKTVSYVHFILNHVPVARLQRTLFGILGVT